MPNKIANNLKQSFSFKNSMIHSHAAISVIIQVKTNRDILEQFKYCEGYVKKRRVIDFLSCDVSLRVFILKGIG